MFVWNSEAALHIGTKILTRSPSILTHHDTHVSGRPVNLNRHHCIIHASLVNPASFIDTPSPDRHTPQIDYPMG